MRPVLVGAGSRRRYVLLMDRPFPEQDLAAGRRLLHLPAQARYLLKSLGIISVLLVATNQNVAAGEPEADGQEQQVRGNHG